VANARAPQPFLGRDLGRALSRFDTLLRSVASENCKRLRALERQLSQGVPEGLNFFGPERDVPILEQGNPSATHAGPGG